MTATNEDQIEKHTLIEWMDSQKIPFNSQSHLAREYSIHLRPDDESEKTFNRIRYLLRGIGDLISESEMKTDRKLWCLLISRGSATQKFVEQTKLNRRSATFDEKRRLLKYIDSSSGEQYESSNPKLKKVIDKVYGTKQVLDQEEETSKMLDDRTKLIVLKIHHMNVIKQEIIFIQKNGSFLQIVDTIGKLFDVKDRDTTLLKLQTTDFKWDILQTDEDVLKAYTINGSCLNIQVHKVSEIGKSRCNRMEMEDIFPKKNGSTIPSTIGQSNRYLGPKKSSASNTARPPFKITLFRSVMSAPRQPFDNGMSKKTSKTDVFTRLSTPKPKFNDAPTPTNSEVQPKKKPWIF